MKIKVKMISRMSGPEGSYAPGTEIEVTSEVAAALIAGGFAVPLLTEENARVMEIETAEARQKLNTKIPKNSKKQS